jgi:orotate phosphoribosyltransferase
MQDLLISTGAIQYGHFVRQDGKHTDMLFSPAKAFQFPPTCRKLAYEIVKHFWDIDPQVIIACRIGALPFAAEIARQLEARLLWLMPGSELLYQSLELHSGDRVVLIDDILTDDISLYKPMIREILRVDARLIGMASLIDLTSRKTPMNVRQISVLKREDHMFNPEDCNMCLQHIESVHIPLRP